MGAARDRDTSVHGSLVSRRAGARVGAALRASSRASGSPCWTADRSTSSSTRAHLGSTGCDGARGADHARRADMGRRTASSATGARSGSVVGTIGPRRPARTDMGFAGTRAILLGAAAGPFLGGPAAARTPARTRIRATRASWRRAGARVGKSACGSLLGRTRGYVRAGGRAGSRMGSTGPILGCTCIRVRRSARGWSVVERARRPCVGCAQERGARRAGRPVVVGTCSPSAGSATAASSAISAAAGSPRVVAAGRARRIAQVPRAADRGARR